MVKLITAIFIGGVCLSRLSYAQLDKLKEHYGVDRIWSHSRLSTYVDQPWEYRIRYLERVKVDTSNIYTEWGSLCHGLLEGLYQGVHKKEDLPQLFENAVLEWRLSEKRHKFMNENVEKGYINNLTCYFDDFEQLDYDVIVEQPVRAVFDNGDDKIVFVGYVDGMYTDEDGNMVLLDFKTSSKGQFSGQKLRENSRQLMLYAIAIHQQTGLPYDKIKARFDMMKYIEVSYLQKNGKWRSSLQEREKWVSSQNKRIRSLLQDGDVDIFEIETMVAQAIADNSIDDLPEYVKERFKLDNGYIEVDVSEEHAKELEGWIVDKVNECYEKEKGDWEIEFPEPVLDPSNEFYFNVLAKGLLKHHEGYQEQQAIKGARGQSVDMDDLEALFK